MTESERYTILLERILETRSGEVSPEMAHLEAKRLSRLSSRHHYLPQYYIKGFCGPDRKVAVYDKQKDSIHSNRKSPKSVFFELDRHSIEINGVKLSMIEDQLFSDTDSRLAPYLIKLRDEPYTDEILTTEIQTHMSVFLIDIFWRNPRADYAAMDLFQRSKMTWVGEKDGIRFEDAEREKQYKEDAVYRKLERFKIGSGKH